MARDGSKGASVAVCVVVHAHTHAVVTGANEQRGASVPESVLATRECPQRRFGIEGGVSPPFLEPAISTCDHQPSRRSGAWHRERRARLGGSLHSCVYSGSSTLFSVHSPGRGQTSRPPQRACARGLAKQRFRWETPC